MTLSHHANITASPPTDSESKSEINNQQQHSISSNNQQQHRQISKWHIKETLGKGAYSWVKKAVDRKTGHHYALKFIEHKKDANGNIRSHQIKQVQTEIQVLKRCKNDNIIRLYAYNLNQKYPDRNGKQRSVIFMCLEYAAGGELFDLLYYTQKLGPILARTYFHQLCNGIQCLHSHGVIHRDIKPQNLLLDKNYCLRIADFGLSKIINLTKVKDNNLKNVKLIDPSCGTRGYQAAEVVKIISRYKNKQNIDGLYYNNSVDIFACGVVLFILLAGFPPFKTADANDPFYQYIAKADYRTWWKQQANRGYNSFTQFESKLITKMLLSDFNERISLDKIKTEEWYKEEILSKKDLQQIMILRNWEMQLKRKMDVPKQKLLQHSDKVRRPLIKVFEAKILAKGYKIDRKPPVLPENIIPNMVCDIWTTANAYEVLQEIKTVIEENMKGLLINSEIDQIFSDSDVSNSENNVENGDIDIDNFCLTGVIAYLRQKKKNETEGIKLHVQLYWDANNKATLVRFDIISRLKSKDFWERKKEIDMWMTLKNVFLTNASHVLNGLPNVSKEITVNNKLKKLYEKCFVGTKNN